MSTVRSCQGVLQMYKKKKWKSYTFKVTGSTYLHYFKADMKKPKGQIFLSKVQSVSIPTSPPKGGKFVFEVNIMAEKTSPWILSAVNNEERSKWIQMIHPDSAKCIIEDEEREIFLSFENYRYRSASDHFYHQHQQRCIGLPPSKSEQELKVSSTDNNPWFRKRSASASTALPVNSGRSTQNVLFQTKLSIDEEPEEDENGYFLMDKMQPFSTCQTLDGQRPLPHESSNDKLKGLTNGNKKDYYYLDDFIIPSSTIQNLDSIGKGNFGEVFKADYKPPNSIKSFEVAVKTLKCGSTTKHTARKEMLKEFAAMATMVHPNIVRLFGVVLEDDPWIVIEYFSLGDLKSYLMKTPKKPVGTLVKYMIDIAMGMHYMAEKGLIHRDLAARNVLVGEGEKCKVADFGLLRELPSDMSIYQSQSLLPLPIRWMPPEAISERLFSEASDVWSYGVLQWELFNPYTIPYKDISNVEMLWHLKCGNRLPIPEPKTCPLLVANIMKGCWNEDPAQRPNFGYISMQLSTKM